MNFFEDYILHFPKSWEINFGNTIDEAVKSFSRSHQAELRVVRDTVTGIISGICNILEALPWIGLVLFVFGLAWFLTRKIHVGLFYGVLLTFIGCCGLWVEMLQTLSIIIASVLLCIAVGFPLGVLLAVNSKIESFFRNFKATRPGTVPAPRVNPLLHLYSPCPAFI